MEEDGAGRVGGGLVCCGEEGVAEGVWGRVEAVEEERGACVSLWCLAWRRERKLTCRA